jgi:hypothetical protein
MNKNTFDIIPPCFSMFMYHLGDEGASWWLQFRDGLTLSTWSSRIMLIYTYCTTTTYSTSYGHLTNLGIHGLNKYICTVLTNVTMSSFGLLQFMGSLKVEWNGHKRYEAILIVTSSSSCSYQGAGPLVDTFRSHTSRSLFNGLPWFLLPLGV